ncbi:MAG: protein phosphatase 2C domain-containing protein [Candidatus Saganbacteria bacterium]|nr:protein phosphatase 2C domain-containing protein [Candidatus Saganbacteria bacterium]
MQSPGVRGLIRTGDLVLFRSHQKPTIRPTLPAEVSAFQAAWLKVISAREEIDTLTGSLEQKRPLADQATASLKETARTIEEKSGELAAQRSAIANAESGVLQEFDANAEAKDLSAQITELNAALSGINNALAVVLGALTTPGLEEAGKDELEGAKREGEEQAGDLTAALKGCRDSLAAFKAVLMGPVEDMRRALVEAEREANLPGLEEQARQLRESSARLGREVQEEGARIDALRETLGTATQDLLGISPAAIMVVSRQYAGTTLADLKTLVEAERLVREELLPLLEDGTELHAQYTADLETLGRVIGELKQSLHEAKLREEAQVIAALSGKAQEYLAARTQPGATRDLPESFRDLAAVEDSLAAIESVLTFLGEHIASWQSFAAEVNHPKSSLRMTVLQHALATAKSDKKVLTFAKLVAEESRTIGELLGAEPPVHFSTVMTSARENPDELAAYSLPELQAVYEKAQTLKAAWETARTSLNDPAFAQDKIEGYARALVELQKIIDLKIGRTNDPVAFHKAQETEFLARHADIKTYLEWKRDPANTAPLPPSFRAAGIEEEQGYRTVAQTLSWLRSRIAFWERLSIEKPDLTIPINAQLAELRILEQRVAVVHMERQMSLARKAENDILKMATGYAPEEVEDTYGVALEQPEFLDHTSLALLQATQKILGDILVVWEPLSSEFPESSEASKKTENLKTARIILGTAIEEKEAVFANAKRKTEKAEADLFPNTDAGVAWTRIRDRMENGPRTTNDTSLAILEETSHRMGEALRLWQGADAAFSPDHPFGELAKRKREGLEALNQAIKLRKDDVAAARTSAEGDQERAWSTTHHRQIDGHIRNIIRQHASETDRVAALATGWDVAALEGVLDGFARSVPIWERANARFPHEKPFEAEVAHARTALSLTKKALARRLHKEALEQIDPIYLVTGPGGTVGMNTAAAVSIAAAGSGNLEALNKETLDQLRITRSLVDKELGIWTKALEKGRRIFTSPEDAALLQSMVDIAGAKTKALENLDRVIAQKEAAPVQTVKFYAGGAEGVITFPGKNIHGLTSIGARAKNEDAILYYEDAQRKVFVCFDGMGGHAGGEVASRIAAEVFSKALGEGKTLQECIALAQAKILEEVEKDLAAAALDGRPEKQTLKGMGSTVAAYEVRGNTLTVVNIGDAPVYVLKQNGTLHQVSFDDNLAVEGYKMDKGDYPTQPIGGEELREYHEIFRGFPNNHIILRALGQTNSTPHVFTCELEEGDIVLGMTDGPRDNLPFNAASKKPGEEKFASFVELLDPTSSLVDLAANIYQASVETMRANGGAHGDNVSVFAYKHTRVSVPEPPTPPQKSALKTAQEAEADLQAQQGDKKDVVRAIFNQGIAISTSGAELARMHSLENLFTALSALRQYCALWETAAQADPANAQIREKIEHRTAAIAKIGAAIEAKVAAAQTQIVAALNTPENEVLRRIILGYLQWHSDPEAFNTAFSSLFPHKVNRPGGKVSFSHPTLAAVSLTAENLTEFIGLLTKEPDTLLKMREMIKTYVTSGKGIARVANYKKEYLGKLHGLLGVVAQAAALAPRPVKSVKAVLLGELFGKFTPDEVSGLAMPKASGGVMRVATASDFYTYVELYLRDPLACIRAENQVLADLYASLPKTKTGGLLGWKAKVGGLTPQAEKQFDQAVRRTMLTRTKIEAALFPNGHKITLAAEITPDKYGEVADNPFLRQHDCSPALLNAELGKPLEHGEVAGINKGEKDSAGDPSVVFEFVIAAKKEAISRLAAGLLNAPDHVVGLAKNIFEQLHISYSDKQSREKGQTGQFLTQAFFMKKGGCCRHRSPVLQMAYQEAGIRSAVYMGFAEKSAHFPGMLSGAHEWVMFDPFDSGTMTHLADPNRQYDDANPNARYLGSAVESVASGWTAADHPELFDRNTHIYNFKSMSDTYRRFTGKIGDKEISYFVAVERFNFIWRPHLSFNLSELQREVQSQA